MVVCKYFLSGNCRFGDRCRNEHLPNGGGSNRNQFSGLDGQGDGRTGRIGDSSKTQPWSIKVEEVEADLTRGTGLPEWILSTYSPGAKGAPASLFDGSEYSFEELRVRYLELNDNNEAAHANQEAQELWLKAQNGIRAVRNNAKDVVPFMEAADKKRPNRYDFCELGGQRSREEFIKSFMSVNSSSSFGPSSITAKPFGQPQSAFGQPSNPSTFGQPSQPSASANSAFGKPAFGHSAFAGTTFGQPSHPTPSFGQPSQPTPAFGQPTEPSSVFGQPTQPSTAFGKPTPPSGFRSSTYVQPVVTNPLAAPSAAGGFARAAQPTSLFGQPQAASPFTQTTQTASPFSGAVQTTSVFGQPSRPNPTFGQPSQPPSSVGQGSTVSIFGQPTKPLNIGNTTTPASGTTAPSDSFNQITKTTLFGSQPTTNSPFSQQPTQPATDSSSGQPNAAVSSPFARRTSWIQTPVENPFAKQVSRSPSGVAVTGPPNTNSSITSHPLTGKPPQAVHYTQTLPSHQPNQKNNATKQVISYKGRRVQWDGDVPSYDRPDGKGKEVIWFPDEGADADVVALRNIVGDLQVSDEEYTDQVKEQYKTLFETGEFALGRMPSVPPMREWCVYDF